MAHRVDDHIDGALISMQAVLRAIARVVDPLPRVTHIGVEGDEAHQPAILVLDSHTMRDRAAFL